MYFYNVFRFFISFLNSGDKARFFNLKNKVFLEIYYDGRGKNKGTSRAVK